MTRITVGNVHRETSIEPQTHMAPITQIEFDDGAVHLDEGRLILTANPPPDDIFFECKDGLEASTSSKFKIAADGEVTGEKVTTAGIKDTLVKRGENGTTINFLNSNKLYLVNDSGSGSYPMLEMNAGGGVGHDVFTVSNSGEVTGTHITHAATVGTLVKRATSNGETVINRFQTDRLLVRNTAGGFITCDDGKVRGRQVNSPLLRMVR